MCSINEAEGSEPRMIDDREITESLWLIPPRDRKDVAVGNEDDVIQRHEISPESSISTKLERKSTLDSDDDDTVRLFLLSMTL